MKITEIDDCDGEYKSQWKCNLLSVFIRIVIVFISALITKLYGFK